MTSAPTSTLDPDPVPRPEHGSFYVTGGTLPLSASSYVVRAADNALLGSLERGEFCYVLNTRQMGKSSLMVRTAKLLREAGVSVAVLDLTAIGQNLTVTQWYNGLLEMIGEQLGILDALESHWDKKSGSGPMHRFLDAIREIALPAVSGSLVIFVDEIDAVRSLPFSTAELFAGIRELYNRRTTEPSLNRLTFCLIGVATPADLIRDTRTTPFNIGTRIDLADFTADEAAPLAKGIVGSRLVLDRVLYWTGGHPYLTQRLCLAIANVPNEITLSSQVDEICEQLFLSRRARESEDNLLFVRERILRTELDLTALLGLYSQILRGRLAVIDDAADPLASALKLAGVIKADKDGHLRVRNRIYAKVFGPPWVNENMPGGEIRRQRRAFHRGAVRVGSIALIIIAVISTLALVALREAQEAQRQSTMFENLLYVSDMQNAQTAWDHGNLGQLRKLLAQTSSFPNRGFEWGYWNRLAYPPGVAVNPGDGPLVACDMSGDGSRFLTAGADNMIRVWDPRSLRQLLSVHYSGDTVSSVNFSLDGSRFNVKDSDSGIAIYNTADGKRLFFSADNHSGYSSGATADSKIAAEFILPVGLRFFDIATHRTTVTVPFDPGVRQCDSSEAGRSDLACVCLMNPCSEVIYNTRTGKRICSLQTHTENSPTTFITGQWSYDDSHFVTETDPSGSFDLWDAASGKLVKHLCMVDESSSLGFIVNKYRPEVLIWSRDRLSSYSTVNGQLLFNVPYSVQPDVFQPMSFSSDGGILSYAGTNGSVELFDCKSGAFTSTFIAHASAVTGIEFITNTSQFLTTSSDGTLRVWDENHPSSYTWHKLHFPGQSSSLLDVTLLNQSRSVVTYDTAEMMKMWNLNAVQAGPYLSEKISVSGETSSCNQRYFVITVNGSPIVNVYDASNGQTVGFVTADNGPPITPQVSDDGKSLAVVSVSGATSLTNVKTGAVLWTHIGSNSLVTAMAFSPSAKLLASGGVERLIDIWDVATGRKITTLAGCTAGISSLVVLPNDQEIVADCNDQTLRCWNISSGKCLWSVQNPLGVSAGMICSGDGSRLVTSANHDAVGVWDTHSGDLLLTIRGRLRAPNAYMSPDGTSLQVCDLDGRFATFKADMHPHKDIN